MKTLNLTLRAATLADLPILLHWDTQPHIIASDLDGNWDWEKELQYQPDWRTQWMAELDGRPIGFLQIIDPAHEETHYWGDVSDGLRAIDVWIGEERDLGKGYGTMMMVKAIEHCFEDVSVDAILIDPLATNLRAHRFYERLGFLFVEQKRLGDDESDCFVYKLNRADWEMPHFNAPLEIIGVNPYVQLPLAVLLRIFEKSEKEKGPIPVRGTVNGKPFRQTLIRFSGMWRLYINMSMLRDSPRRIGEMVEIAVAFDPEKRTIDIPPAFLKALDDNSLAFANFHKQIPSRKLEIIRYLANLKSEAALHRNIEKIIKNLTGDGDFFGRKLG